MYKRFKHTILFYYNNMNYLKNLLGYNDTKCIKCIICAKILEDNDKDTLCISCFNTYTDNLERQCELCEKTFMISDHNMRFCSSQRYRYSKHSEQIETRCAYCFGNEKRICKCCGSMYVGIPNSYKQCKDCEMVHYSLTEQFRIPPTLGGIKNGSILEITYDTHQETHSGYCSDPYDEEEIDFEEICKYPLMNIITEEHISNFMEDPNGDDVNPVNYYITKCGPCGGGGSGYCGMISVLRVKDMKIVNEEIDIHKYTGINFYPNI